MFLTRITLIIRICFRENQRNLCFKNAEQVVVVVHRCLMNGMRQPQFNQIDQLLKMNKVVFSCSSLYKLFDKQSARSKLIYYLCSDETVACCHIGDAGGACGCGHGL